MVALPPALINANVSVVVPPTTTTVGLKLLVTPILPTPSVAVLDAAPTIGVCVDFTPDVVLFRMPTAFVLTSTVMVQVVLPGKLRPAIVSVTGDGSSATSELGT